ncbi:MAG: hypothetical protein AB4062_15615 [Crocosphaera sp.]
MARNRYDWTQDKFERYVKEGRGTGTGKDYKPWILSILILENIGKEEKLKIL